MINNAEYFNVYPSAPKFQCLLLMVLTDDCAVGLVCWEKAIPSISRPRLQKQTDFTDKRKRLSGHTLPSAGTRMRIHTYTQNQKSQMQSG